MEESFLELKKEFAELGEKIADSNFIQDQKQYQQAAKRFSLLSPLAEKISQLEKLEKAVQQTNLLLGKEKDQELLKLAEEEKTRLEQEKISLFRELEKEVEALAGEEKAQTTANEILLEIRAGTGGDEAALFALDLFRMYQRYAEKNGWSFKVLSESRDELGGYKEVVVEIKGKKVFSLLRYERGVHRVQRIPETEKSGRIHTSTATVAVLPVLKDVSVEVEEKDLEISFTRSGGPGGQNVNKLETAVRIKHLPTGIVVACQSERHQHQNKERALGMLKAKLYQIEQEKQQEKISSERRTQVGTGERSEKIRTYNYPQDRITDHRVGESWKNIQKILAGDLDLIISSLSESGRN
ncbi:MAG: peptide chain release factor 1 [Patescibacteria group bacterium]